MMKATQNLSSGVLQMKFMTKTRKKLEEQADKRRIQELKKEFISNAEEETAETSKRRNIESCKDRTSLEDLAFGRMSFKGCNPEVEKYMLYYERKRRGEPSDDELEDDETDISDVKMAETLAGAASSIANKFKGKKSHNQKERNYGNQETSSDRLNFDASSIRKRKSGPDDFSHYPPKFMKPSD